MSNKLISIPPAKRKATSLVPDPVETLWLSYSHEAPKDKFTCFLFSSTQLCLLKLSSFICSKRFCYSFLCISELYSLIDFLVWPVFKFTVFDPVLLHCFCCLIDLTSACFLNMNLPADVDFNRLVLALTSTCLQFVTAFFESWVAGRMIFLYSFYLLQHLHNLGRVSCKYIKLTHMQMKCK